MAGEVLGSRWAASRCLCHRHHTRYPRRGAAPGVPSCAPAAPVEDSRRRGAMDPGRLALRRLNVGQPCTPVEEGPKMHPQTSAAHAAGNPPTDGLSRCPTTSYNKWGDTLSCRCTTCGASRGQPCKTSTGRPLLGAHAARHAAVQLLPLLRPAGASSPPRPYRRPPSSTPHVAQLARSFDARVVMRAR